MDPSWAAVVGYKCCEAGQCHLPIFDKIDNYLDHVHRQTRSLAHTYSVLRLL